MSDRAQELRQAARLHATRADVLEREARAQERIVALMEQRGYADTAELLAAVECGEIELLPDEEEALIRLGAM